MICTGMGSCLKIQDRNKQKKASSWCKVHNLVEVPVLPGSPDCDSSREMDTQENNSTVTLLSPGQGL